MEPCLEAACKLAVVERKQGRSSDSQPSTEEVIEHLRPDAFASPGSLLGVQSILTCRWIMNKGAAFFLEPFRAFCYLAVHR